MSSHSTTVNFFQDFKFWTKIHYYAFIHRNTFPNLFFYHFPYSGLWIKELKEDERQIIFDYISKNKISINGLWGYISLLLENKNGEEIYKLISKTEYFEPWISFPCFQEKKCFDQVWTDKYKKILQDYSEKYNSVHNNFKDYLWECDTEKQRDFNSYAKDNANWILFSYSKSDLLAWLQQKLEANDNSLGNIIKQNEGNSIANNNNNNNTTKKIRRVIRKKKVTLTYSDSESDSVSESNSNSQCIEEEEDYTYTHKITSANSHVKADKGVFNDVEYWEHEHKFNGYASDYTKQIYKKEFNYCVSDEEDLKIKRRNKKVSRVNMKGKTVINNIKLNRKYDCDNIGIKSEILSQYDQWKRNLKERRHYRKRRNKAKEAQKKHRTDTKAKVSTFAKEWNSKQKNKSLLAEDPGERPSKKKKIIGDSYFDLSSTKKHKSIGSLSCFLSNNTNDNYMKKDNSDASSVSSFVSLFSSHWPNIKKKQNKRNRAIDNSKNQKIQSFIPIISSISLQKEKNIISQVNKLILNRKFSYLIELWEAKHEVIDAWSQQVNSMKMNWTNNSIEIDNNTLLSIAVEQDCNAYSINDNITIRVLNIQESQVINLIKYYKQAIADFFSIICNPVNTKNNDENTLITALKQAEHLLKLTVQYINSNVIINSLLASISEILSTFISIAFIIQTKGNDISCKTYALMLNTFVQICNALHSRTKNPMLLTLLNKFFHMIWFWLWVKIYTFKESHFESSDNDETIAIVSLFGWLCETYHEMNGKSNKTNTFDFIKEVFGAYLYTINEIDLNNKQNIQEALNEDIEKYLSPIITYLHKDKFEEGLKSKLKKYFMFSVFEVENSMDLSPELQKILRHKAMLILFERYFYAFFLCFEEHGKPETVFPLYYIDYITRCKDGIIDNYYDIQDIHKLISDVGNYKTVYDNEIFEKYLLNDTQILIHVDTFWPLNIKNKVNIIFGLFSVINLQNRKNKPIASNILTNEIFKWIPEIFDASVNTNSNGESWHQSVSPIVSFIYNISKLISNAFTKTETDEINRKRFFSLFIPWTSPFKSNIIENSGWNYKINIIPIVSIILTFVQFTNQFVEKNNVSIVLKKIQEWIKIESSSTIMKSFNLSIWIKLLQQLTAKNVDWDIKEYIQMINGNIADIILKYKKYGDLLDYQYETNNELNENSETIINYLNNFKWIACDSPDICFNNLSILKEMKELLNCTCYYPITFRLKVWDIITVLTDKLEEDIIEANTVQFTEDDGDVVMAPISDDIVLNQKQIDVWKYLKGDYWVELDRIMCLYWSKENFNTSTRKKVHFNWFEAVSLVHCKIQAWLDRHKFTKPFEYCIRILRDCPFVNTKKISKWTGLIQSTDIEHFVKLPFKLMWLYWKTNHTLVSTQWDSDEYKSTLQYFLILFIWGAYMKHDKALLYKHRMFEKYYQMTSQTDEYCFYFIRWLRDNKDKIQHVCKHIQNDPSNIERIKERWSYYTIYNIISNYDKETFSVVNFLSAVFDRIRDKVIDTKHFFGIVNHDFFLGGLERMTQIVQNPVEKNQLINLIYNTNFYILGMFTRNYVIRNLDGSLLKYWDNFIIKINLMHKAEFKELWSNVVFIRWIEEYLEHTKEMTVIPESMLVEYNKIIRTTKEIIFDDIEKIDLTKEDNLMNYSSRWFDNTNWVRFDLFYAILNNVVWTEQNKHQMGVFYLKCVNHIIAYASDITEAERNLNQWLSKIEKRGTWIIDCKSAYIYYFIILKTMKLLFFLNELGYTISQSTFFNLHRWCRYHINYVFYYAMTKSTKNEEFIMNKWTNTLGQVNWIKDIDNHTNISNRNDFSWYFMRNKSRFLLKSCGLYQFYIEIAKFHSYGNDSWFEELEFLEFVNDTIIKIFKRDRYDISTDLLNLTI